MSRLASGRVARHELGTDGRGENFSQYGAHVAAQPIRLRNPSDHVLDQGLGNARVDGIVRHVVADAVSAPSERKLAEIAGSDHDRVVMVGETEQDAGAFARLN